MGLSICYELSLPAETADAEVRALLGRLREDALTLPLEATSELVCLTHRDFLGPWPLRGLAFQRLEDVVDVHGRLVRTELYRDRLGVDEYACIDLPVEMPALVI